MSMLVAVGTACRLALIIRQKIATVIYVLIAAVKQG
jgi:hypothetical protein